VRFGVDESLGFSAFNILPGEFMTEPRTDGEGRRESADRSAQPVQYPENHVLGVVDTPEQLRSAAKALTGGGFLTSELGVSCGTAAADALDATTGRTGLAGLAIRIAEKLGIENDEMAVKERYEQALRDGRFVVAISAPTEERKALAAKILQENGGHFVNFLGRYTMVRMHP
jgi:hypothetical protein